MHPVISLRSATVADADSIARLAAQLGYPDDSGTIAARLDRILAAPDHLTVVAECRGEIAGWLHALVIEPIETPRRVQILGLVTDDAFRRQGIGRSLVERAERWALDLGVDLIGVSSNVSREESHPFYRELGYKVVKTQAAYRKSL